MNLLRIPPVEIDLACRAIPNSMKPVRDLASVMHADDLEFWQNWVTGHSRRRKIAAYHCRPGAANRCGATGRLARRMQPSGAAKCCCVRPRLNAGLGPGRDYVFA